MRIDCVHHMRKSERIKSYMSVTAMHSSYKIRNLYQIHTIPHQQISMHMKLYKIW